MARRISSDESSGAAFLLDVVRALRPLQWAKNLLLFVPLVLTPQAIGDQARQLALVLAFVCFSLCASAGYVLNDLLDLQADRQHPTKRHRPFASGALPIPLGIALIALLLALGLGLGFLSVAPSFLSVLGVYLVSSVAYSVFLKRQLLIDVIVLAGLYTLRVVAGAAAVSIALTPWLLAFSLFIFLSLAFAKRYSELVLTAARREERVPRRAYQVGDLDLVLILGASSGYLSVLVLCLYINSDLVGQLYQTVEILWLLCPILLYWIGRIWFLAKRGELPGDPVAFAVGDPVSYLMGLLAIAVVGAAVL
jgi:4-hydroxybenzoate polyprenyltransferase